jgi:PAS domain S-box-containing protein
MCIDGSTTPRAENLPWLLSTIAHRAETSAQVIEGILHLLQQTGFIVGGQAEILSEPPLRVGVGDTTQWVAKQEQDTPPSTSDSATSENERMPPGVLSISIPTRSAPPARLLLQLGQPADSNLWHLVAEQTALALDRTYLEAQTHLLRGEAERRIQEVLTIYDIGWTIDSVEFDRLLEVIVQKAARIMDAQACSLMRLNPDTNTLTIAASYGLPEDIVFVAQRAMGEGIAGFVAQTGEPMLIADTCQDPRLKRAVLRPDIGSSMVVPIKVEEGQVMGVLSIRRRRPAPEFTKEDMRLFMLFAKQAALAIGHKQLYDDLHRRLKELSTLSELTQAMISHLDLNRLLETVADNIVEVVKLDRCCIFLLDRSSRRLVPRILRGYRPEVIGRNPVRMGEGVVGLVARKQIPIIEMDARNAIQPIRGFARALGAASFVAIPLVFKGQSIGVVVADNKPSGRSIHPQCVELLTTFVSQAAIAIENAQLYAEREQRYQEMIQLATETDNILRSIAASVVVVDAGGRVTRWNKASEEMWGISEEEAMGLSYVEISFRLGLSPEDVAQLQMHMQQVLQTGRPYQGYRMALHPHQRGELFVNVLLSPLTNRHGENQGVVQIMEDVTNDVRLEAEMSRMRRLADIGQLAAKVAHEVRNPLSSIKGAAQLMRQEYADIGPLREFLDIIVEEVNGLSRITNDLLDFARPMQLDLHPTNLNDLVERSLNLLKKELAESQVNVVRDLEPLLPEISGDPKQIEQVMRNIIINAIQAMQEGGVLTVSTRYNHTEQTVTASFRDTGVGIAPEKLEEIFQPFVTTKTKGTGLGLPIVRKIMENHGGRVGVSSTPGEGTTFSVTFLLRPIVSAPPEAMCAVNTYPLPSSLPDF